MEGTRKRRAGLRKRKEMDTHLGALLPLSITLDDEADGATRKTNKRAIRACRRKKEGVTFSEPNNYADVQPAAINESTFIEGVETDAKKMKRDKLVRTLRNRKNLKNISTSTVVDTHPAQTSNNAISLLSVSTSVSGIFIEKGVDVDKKKKKRGTRVGRQKRCSKNDQITIDIQTAENESACQSKFLDLSGMSLEGEEFFINPLNIPLVSEF